MKREPKLRPSLTWGEISLAVAALETSITNAVRAKQVNKQVMGMVKVKEYLETFQPAVEAKSETEQLAYLMEKFGLAKVAPTSSQETPENNVPDLPDTVVDPTPLTDDERYDVLKIAGESSYTEDDTKFMNGPGFVIMMNRAQKKPIKAGDL